MEVGCGAVREGLGLACSGAEVGLGLEGLEGAPAALGGVENRARVTDDSPPPPPPPPPPSTTPPAPPAPPAAATTPCRVVVSEANSLTRASAQRLDESCCKRWVNQTSKNEKGVKKEERKREERESSNHLPV